MSTRSVFTFIDRDDDDGIFHIYMHYDGYPSGALEAIKAAVPYTWELPRFEAAEFSAAFVRGNKDKGGGIYLTSNYLAHADLEYRYEITANKEKLLIKAFELEMLSGLGKEIFSGDMEKFENFAQNFKDES